MAKALSELANHTRVYLDEKSAKDWSDIQVFRAVNYAYMEVYAAVVETYEDYYRTKFSTTLKANQQEYLLPDNTYKVRRLEVQYDPNGRARKAQPFNFDSERSGIGDVNTGSSSAPMYYLSGNVLGLKPVPAVEVASGLRGWIIVTPNELVETTDEINIPFPERYAGLIPLGAAGELLRKGQQEETVASKYLDDFRIGLEKMKQELEDRFADGFKYIIDSIGDTNDFGGPTPTSIQVT